MEVAERRMFTKKITESDAFLDMPLSAQALYFHINMAADDDGFVNNPRKIQRVIGASEDDLKLLLMKNFLIAYDNGVIVVKHWRMHNYIQKDRYHPTVYQEEFSTLAVKKNGAYTTSLNTLDTKCIQNVSNLDTEVRLGKDSIGKVSIGKDNNNVGIPDYAGQVKEIIEYFNLKTHSKYRADSKGNRNLIIPRLKDGYEVDDFKRIIDNKCASWLGNKEMAGYLRPETLFCLKHFESYLNERPQAKSEDVVEEWVNDES